jgi:hypothetical protein
MSRSAKKEEEKMLRKGTLVTINSPNSQFHGLRGFITEQSRKRYYWVRVGIESDETEFEKDELRAGIHKCAAPKRAKKGTK